MHENNVRNRDLYPLCKKLGLPWRRALHNMRHGHGSHLLERGVPLRTVAERLGHKDPAFTARVYAHVIRSQAQAAAAVSAMLKEARESLLPSCYPQREGAIRANP